MWREYFNKKTLNSALAWIYLLAGVVLLLIGYIYNFKEDSIWETIFCKLGEVFLVSVLFSFLTTSEQFSNILKNCLEDIYVSDRFLKKRNDIEDIWARVSKIMFKQKFSSIHDKLINTIKSSYLPMPNQDEVVYYSNRRSVIDIEWDDEEHIFMCVKENVSLKIHTDSKDTIEYPNEFWLKCNPNDEIKIGGNDGINRFKINYKYNGKEIAYRIIENTNKEECRYIKLSIELSGKTEYEIEYDVIRRYSIEDDDFIAFRSKYLTNNLYLTISYPKDMAINFLPRGTINDFKCLIRNKSKNFVEYQYEDLILRRQGYIITLKKT